MTRPLLPPWPPLDDHPSHREIMRNWVRGIVDKVADRMAESIVEDISAIFLETKNSNYELHKRLRLLEEAAEARKKRLKT